MVVRTRAARRGMKAFSLGALAILIIGNPCQPASSMVLSGHLEHSQEAEENKQSNNTGAQSGLQSKSQGGQRQKPSTVQPGASTLNPNTFPASYVGTWSCETTVTESTVSTVEPGLVIKSDITFYPTQDGRVQAHFNQPGWIDNQCMAVTFNTNEAKSDRTSYYFGENSQGSWAARTRDQFKLINSDLISARSYVDQYLDGQYIGRYRSVSQLKRLSDTKHVAGQ